MEVVVDTVEMVVDEAEVMVEVEVAKVEVEVDVEVEGEEEVVSSSRPFKIG